MKRLSALIRMELTSSRSPDVRNVDDWPNGESKLVALDAHERVIAGPGPDRSRQGQLRGMNVAQHDVSLSVSGASGSAEFGLRVDLGDAVLVLECEIEDFEGGQGRSANVSAREPSLSVHDEAVADAVRRTDPRPGTFSPVSMATVATTLPSPGPAATPDEAPDGRRPRRARRWRQSRRRGSGWRPPRTRGVQKRANSGSQTSHGVVRRCTQRTIQGRGSHPAVPRAGAGRHRK